jgi:hypothetical protein
VVSKDVKTGRITEDLKAEPATTFKVFEVERDSSGKEMKTALAIINNADKTGKDGWALRYSDISGEHPINHKHFIKSENASVDDSYAVAGHAVLSAYSTAALHSPVQPETSNSSQPNDSYAAPGLLIVQMEKGNT